MFFLCKAVFAFYMLTAVHTVFSMVSEQNNVLQKVSLLNLFEKVKSKNTEELAGVYTLLIKNKAAFFQDSLSNFQRPNAIEKIPTHHIFLEKYDNFSNLIEEQIAQDALTTHAVVSDDVLTLIQDFIIYKSQYSHLHMTFLQQFINRPLDYINRLLTKRPEYFFGSNDATRLLLDKIDVAGFIEDMMTQSAIERYISYDEMCISALIGLCSPTFCINDGNRYNQCVLNPKEIRALYCGLVGPRFERLGFMEWQHLVITEEQNTVENGYGKEIDVPSLLESNYDQKYVQFTKNKLLHIWATFYKINYFPTYIEAKKSSHDYIKLINSRNAIGFFNKNVYIKRLRTIVEPFLKNANVYGNIHKKQIYVHVAGLGTGVWSDIANFSVAANQKNIPGNIRSCRGMLSYLQMCAYAQSIVQNIDLLQQHITNIDFSYWDTSINTVSEIFEQYNQQILIEKKYKTQKRCLYYWFLNIKKLVQKVTRYFDTQLDFLIGKFCTIEAIILNNKIKITCSKRNPFATLNVEDRDKLIVANYAWDSNAFPGNEYYMGLLDPSGDPAAACATTIADLGNPFINPEGLKNIVVY